MSIKKKYTELRYEDLEIRYVFYYGPNYIDFINELGCADGYDQYLTLNGSAISGYLLDCKLMDCEDIPVTEGFHYLMKKYKLI